MMRSISVAAVLIIVALLALASCSSNTPDAMSVSQAGTRETGLSSPNRLDGAPAAQNLPLLAQAGLPPVHSLRSSSALVEFSQYGNEFSQCSVDATTDVKALVLASAADSISYGIWHFAFAQDATDCEVTLSTENAGEAWFAVADFSSNRWIISGPATGPSANIDLSTRDYARPGTGDLYIAVLTYNGSSFYVDRLDLNLDVTGGARDVDASGGYTSMVLVQGRPAIAFFEQDNDDLRYVRALDPFGSAWGASQIVDGFEDTGLFNSMAIVDGNPAIAYHNTTSDELRYVRATDNLGDAWGAPEILAGSGADSMGEFPSLAVVSGQPAVAFHDQGNGTLRYVRASDATGDTWPASMLLDAANNCGQYPSLVADVNDVPAIAYRAGGSADLRFIQAMDTNGDAWKPVVTVDDDIAHNPGFHNSMKMVGLRPTIACYDGSESTLVYYRADDINGASWPAPVTLDGLADDTGSHCSMELVNGVPAISYHSGLNGDLRYISALDADGTAWGSGAILDESAVLTGKDTCLIVVAGHPAISYFDQTNGKLRYIWGF